MNRRNLTLSVFALLAVVLGYFGIGGTANEVGHLFGLLFCVLLVASVFFRPVRHRDPF